MLTNEQIQSAADRIVAALKPKKIILFGSYARGDATEHSDLDLMVIEPTTTKKELDAMILGRDAVGIMGTGVDVIVYDGKTFEGRKDWCSSPIKWARLEGKVLYDEPIDFAKIEFRLEWEMLFKRAEEDRKVLMHILFVPDISLSSSCFHAQQAVEKYIKAVLSKKSIKFPFTHDLEELVKLYDGKLPISLEQLKKLNPFAVKARYDEPPEIDATREEIAAIVNSMADWCKEQIND